MTTAVEVQGPRAATASAVDPPMGVSCPSNLHLSVGCPGSGLAPLPERVEQKYFVRPQRQSLALALLRRTCRVEALHPADQVNSLYFDTPDLDQHERSLAGEYAKDKIRIRWYGEEYNPHHTDGMDGEDMPAQSVSADGAEGPTVQVWLELKSRRGFASMKQRLPFDVPATALAFSALSRGIVPADLLMRTMAGFGFIARRRLVSVVAISYRRFRFVEPETGSRVSIDSHIRSSVIMPGIGRGERGLELPGAVVEVKGSLFDLPRSLHRLAEIGTSWTRYSKYSSSLEGHEAVAGSASRLWPTGMMDSTPGILARVRTTGWVSAAGTGDGETGEPGSSRHAPRLVDEYETE
jgi:VTC domain